MGFYEDLANFNSADNLNRLRTQATQTLQPTLDLGNQQLSQNALDVNQSSDQLAKTLQDQARSSRGSLLEDQNNLGLLQSGLTSSGLGKIQTDLNTNVTNNEQQRASKLANIAIQRAGLGQTFQSNIGNLVNQLLGGQIDQYKATHAAPSAGGSSSGIDPLTGSLLAALLGGGQNTPAQPSKESIVSDLTNTLHDAFSQGINVQGTESILPSLYNEFQGVLTPDEINQIVFATRKPYETVTRSSAYGPANPIRSANIKTNTNLNKAIGGDKLAQLNKLFGF